MTWFGPFIEDHMDGNKTSGVMEPASSTPAPSNSGLHPGPGVLQRSLCTPPRCYTSTASISGSIKTSKILSIQHQDSPGHQEDSRKRGPQGALAVPTVTD